MSQKADLNYLPDFASFLLSHHKSEFLQAMLQLLRDLKLPLIQPLNNAEAENLSHNSALELLTALAQGTPAVHIQQAIERWRTNQFPKVKHNQTVIQDVTLIAYARKMVFLKFIPFYTSDPVKIIALSGEIEGYTLEYTSKTLNDFVRIIDERLTTHLVRLQESEQLYKQAETLAHIGNWKWDVEKNEVHWTDELYRIYGLKPQSQGITFEIYISFAHPEDREMILNIITNTLKSKQPYEFFHRIISADNQIKILHARGEVLTNDQGIVYQMIGSAQDVTALKETEKKLLEYQQILLHRTQELQQSNASLEEFAYVASHDLKEPLRKISIFIDRLSPLRSKCTEKEKQYFDKIHNAAMRMKEMIDDLLSLSLIRSDKALKLSSLKKIIREVLQIFEHSIEEKQAIIKMDDLPKVNIEPSQFKQLIQNLMANSLKFVRPSVKPLITITHRYLSAKDVQQHNLPHARQYLELQFADNGIGFDNACGEKIFAVFQRLHHKHEYEGTGIGLAICRKIVKNHNGILLAHGRVDEGATFIIIIPA